MDEAVKRSTVRDIMEEAGARSISSEAPPRTDVGTLTLHWVTAIAFIVSLLTGIRIAADALKAPVSKWLSPVLPQGEIWSWHFLAGLTLFFCASAYIVYLMRSGLARAQQPEENPRLEDAGARLDEMGRGERRAALVSLRAHRLPHRHRGHPLSRLWRLVGLSAFDRGLRGLGLHLRACAGALPARRLVAGVSGFSPAAPHLDEGGAAKAASHRAVASACCSRRSSPASIGSRATPWSSPM